MVRVEHGYWTHSTDFYRKGRRSVAPQSSKHGRQIQAERQMNYSREMGMNHYVNGPVRGSVRAQEARALVVTTATYQRDSLDNQQGMNSRTMNSDSSDDLSDPDLDYHDDHQEVLGSGALKRFLNLTSQPMNAACQMMEISLHYYSLSKQA